MSKFWAIVIAAALLGAGLALNGYFVGQQGVNFFRAQVEEMQKQIHIQLDNNG